MGLQPGQLPELIDSTMIAFNFESQDDQGAPGDANYIAGWKGWSDRTKKFLKKYEDQVTEIFDIAYNEQRIEKYIEEIARAWENV